jgi:hypothetical protein
MRLINEIDNLIQLAHHRIKFIEDSYFYHSSEAGVWNRGYDKGYIAGLLKYIDDLNHLKNIMLNISLIQFGDDDDV